MTDPTFQPPKSLDVPPSSKKGMGCLVVLGAVVIIIIIATIAGALSGSGETPYDANWSGEAIAQCEDLVREDLKAPTTAEFDTNATGDGTWTVTGTVDSENSFGAMLRADFQCTVIIDGDSIKRRLDYLE